MQECPAPPFAAADADHVQRSVLNLILGATSGLRDMRVDLHVLQTASGPTLTIRIPGAEAAMAVADVFEPFPPSGGANGLALATARRLVENQHGSLRAVTAAGALEFVMELPPASRTGDSSSHPLLPRRPVALEYSAPLVMPTSRRSLAAIAKGQPDAKDAATR